MTSSKSKNDEPLSLDDLIDAAELPGRVVSVCLRGDLVAQIEDLDAQLVEKRKLGQTLADAGDARLLAEQIEQLRAEMQRHSVQFHLRGLTRPEKQALEAKHPPRDGNDNDKAMGFNEETFYVPLIRACLVEPEISDAQWAKLEPRLSDGQIEELARAAWHVTTGAVRVPFSSAAFKTLRRSEETSQ